MFSFWSIEAKKNAGTLDSFDPSSPNVHPKWRIKFKLTISKRRASISASSAHGSHFSNESAVPESDEEDEYSEDDSERPVARRSTRHKTQTSALPFSPRKTRSRTVYPVFSDEESDVPPARRSQRMRPTKIPLDEDEFSQSDDSGGSDEYANRARDRKSKDNRKGKGKKGYKGTKPEYGRFRSVDEFAEDPDPETRELREHWKMCGKCHEQPAHKLLEYENKRAKKGKRRKRHSDDEDADDEVERIKSKGGWIRW